MVRLVILQSLLILFASCKQVKNATEEKEKMSEDAFNSSIEKGMQEIIDSIKTFKPVKLSIAEENSDLDELIPVGYNNHGSFAYFLHENSGGASTVHFDIVPSYDYYSTQTRFETDLELDTLLIQNKELIYYPLKTSGIKLQNSIGKISLDSLQNQYKFKLEVKKTYGPPDTNYGTGRKTLASVWINYHQGEMSPTDIIDKKLTPAHGVYDVYISDYLVVPGEEGVFVFAVLVTEGLGFEGYIRKSIEVIPIGVINGQ